ncbi:ABC transporter permease [Roseovarius sp. MMSF_3281]|uniref:ABC transporter permease n=1 Tax=Roseovarius sp. MMSF_3281 TaxID=3046694 RepID=UPI00273E92E6|nr:ABC transporter permease [Roseovarius sp. MMSF_3281]
MSDSALNAMKSRRPNFAGAGQVFGVLGVLILICVVASFVAPQFMTSYNMTIISRELAFIGMVAIGQGILLLLGDIDVSIGAIAGLAGIVCTKLLVDVEVDPIFAITAGLIVGAMAGAVNGTIITFFNLNSLVVTIGMLSVYSGLNLWITKGRTIVGLSPEVTFLGGGSFFGLPLPMYFMLAAFVVILFVTTKTIYGRRLYAVGNSREAAKIVGINEKRVRITAYAIAGALAGLAGMLLCFRLVSAQASMGQSWLLPSIAAPVIGGIATTGGIGTIWGALIGAAIIAVIGNVIVLGGVNVYLQQVVTGLIVVVAVAFDAISRRMRQD